RNGVHVPAQTLQTFGSDNHEGGIRMNEYEEVTDILRGVLDPELGIDVVSLGLIYELEISPGEVYLSMATTSPMCPKGEVLRSSAEDALRRRFRMRAVTVELVD